MRMDVVRPRERTMDSPVLIAQPVLHGVVSTGLVLFFLLVAAVLVFGRHSRQETVKGKVVSRAAATTLVSEYPGSIADLRVKVGDKVRPGQVVAVVRVARIVGKDGDRASMGIERLRAIERNIDLQRAEARAQVAGLQLIAKQLPASRETALASLKNVRGAAVGQRGLVRQRLEALDTLQRRGFAAKTAVDDARGALLSIESSIAGSFLNEAEIRRSYAEYDLTLQTQTRSAQQALLGLDNQYLQVESQIQDLAVQEFVNVVATSDGLVTALSVRSGERVEASQRLMAVADPRDRLIVALDVPDNAIGFIEPGQRVVLKYDAFPYEMFGVKYGRVLSVPTATSPDDASAAAGADPRRTFLVEVMPDAQSVTALGQPRPLKIGMGVTAEIQLERRRLIEWILEPLYAVKGQL